MQKKLTWTVIAVILAVLLLVWGASLIKCEILTAKYYDDFKAAHLQNTMLQEDMEYFKVLRCNGKTAEVYYVGRDMSGGNVLTFEKQDGVWKQIKWETIWSGTGGSASDVIYPYWWHFIYGGI